MFSDIECPWFAMHSSHKTLLGACIIVFGLSGVLLNSWMVTSFVQSQLLSFRSHLLILNLCTSCLARGLLGGFPFAGPSALVGRWAFGEPCCKLFAFLHQILWVFQMAALTAMCFERFLLAKRRKYGKDISFRFYALCLGMCWALAALFAVPPLLQYGSYSCDVTGTICSLDWRLSGRKQTVFLAPLALFTGVLPVLIIIVSLWKAVALSRRRRATEEELEQWSLTKSTVAVAVLMLLMWTPGALLAGWAAFSGWAAPAWGPPPSPPPALALLAPLASEASAMVPILCYLASEPRVRTALLGRCRKDYGIIRRLPRASGFTPLARK